jgi:hypothetical protein
MQEEEEEDEEEQEEDQRISSLYQLQNATLPSASSPAAMSTPRDRMLADVLRVMPLEWMGASHPSLAVLL